MSWSIGRSAISSMAAVLPGEDGVDGFPVVFEVPRPAGGQRLHNVQSPAVLACGCGLALDRGNGRWVGDYHRDRFPAPCAQQRDADLVADVRGGVLDGVRDEFRC